MQKNVLLHNYSGKGQKHEEKKLKAENKRERNMRKSTLVI